MRSISVCLFVYILSYSRRILTIIVWYLKCSDYFINSTKFAGVLTIEVYFSIAFLYCFSLFDLLQNFG